MIGFESHVERLIGYDLLSKPGSEWRLQNPDLTGELLEVGAISLFL